ncbi:MAG TPA: class I SAM-dependent methyltransferase [Chryseosolibacter sp.]|nr:class I SAM-dependent methyltransferase [Chryseosolibacter sp.]
MRLQEGRLYPDEVVATLPWIDVNHPFAKEWAIRSSSLARLVRHLRQLNPQSILEIGCGNGWLIYNIQQQVGADCCGIDINELELRQAASVFGKNKNLSFVYGNIADHIFEGATVDVIILASVIQYFRDPVTLFEELVRLVNPGGEVHVLDSPVYSSYNVAAAHERSARYFTESGNHPMQSCYFHHTRDIFSKFNVSTMYNPHSWTNRALRKMSNRSPFPWIVIKK